MLEFERLRRESLYFPAAYPPSSETLTSLPALLCGRPVTTPSPAGDRPSVDIYNEMGRLDYRSLPNISPKRAIWDCAAQLSATIIRIPCSRPRCR